MTRRATTQRRTEKVAAAVAAELVDMEEEAQALLGRVPSVVADETQDAAMPVDPKTTELYPSVVEGRIQRVRAGEAAEPIQLNLKRTHADSRNNKHKRRRKMWKQAQEQSKS